ncbi:MAG: hypothetical protein J0L84_00195 [Verrucomicrobia bacterium]|nr:hypothetical protein [Verrucomicrobiota bacterium]
MLRHLIQRLREREITAEQLAALRGWLMTEPEVPAGPWYKEFGGLTVCGDGELIKTFLVPGQLAFGTKL